MIQLFDITKTYGVTTAVSGLTATIQPGVVTGFLGPNGAGKSTTMRVILGLDKPTRGNVLVNGHRLADSTAPLREIGAVLDARAMMPNRTARQHLLIIAHTHNIPRSRVDEMLALTGLMGVAGSRIGAFSLGMTQRLAIAAALLGDPAVLMFDEPVNGLDPEGVAWVRNLLRQQAALGKTVLVSSHLMSEMQHTADQLLIVGHGRLLADVAMADFIAGASGVAARVTSPDIDAIVNSFAGPGVQSVPLSPGTVELRGVDIKQVAVRASEQGWLVYQLAPVEVSLEDAYLQLTASSVAYVSGGATVAAGYQTSGPAWRPAAPGEPLTPAVAYTAPSASQVAPSAPAVSAATPTAPEVVATTPQVPPMGDTTPPPPSAFPTTLPAYSMPTDTLPAEPSVPGMPDFAAPATPVPPTANPQTPMGGSR